MGRRRFSVVEASGVVTDDPQCIRTDGRRWRCPMPALPNISYCEHHRSLSLRNSAAEPQQTVLVPELPQPNRVPAVDPITDSHREKLNRTFDPLPRRRKKRRRRDNGAGSEPRTVDQGSDRPAGVAMPAERDSDLEKPIGALDSLATKKKRRRREKGSSGPIIGEKGADSGLMSEDLIRMAVKRQMKRREEKRRSEESAEVVEVRRELPNGVMAISSAAAAAAAVKNSTKVEKIIDKKVGLGFHEGTPQMRRRFRSKNVEPEPVGSVKKFPRVLGRRRKPTCRVCGEKKTLNDKRISCKTCMCIGAEDSGFQEITNGQNNNRIRYADCFISQLLPVSEQLNWKEIFELEIEAITQGKRFATVKLQVIECSHDVQFKCNYCRISIVNLHRSCSKCHYKLCPSCCQEIRGEGLAEGADILTCQDPRKQKDSKHVNETPDEIRTELSSKFHSPMINERTDKNRGLGIPCPPRVLGGCGDGILSMKFILPFGWKQKPDSAEQVAFNFVPEGCVNGG